MTVDKSRRAENNPLGRMVKLVNDFVIIFATSIEFGGMLVTRA
jgi:hypothetical protein